MRTLRVLLPALLFAGVAAAQETRPITVGRLVERTMAAGEPHAYTLSLDAGQFVAGRAVQRGVDVVVRVAGPGGEALGEFDSPNGTSGPEPFQFETEAAGEYRIIIAPFEEGSTGRYDLVVARAEPAATTPEGKVDQRLATTFGPDTPGAVVAVIRGGEVAFARAYGMANLTHGVPFTVDTPSNIGSVSKQFTAFAIGLLARQGRLSLDDDVRTYIPELPDFGQPVTLRHLLTHTSGYREVLNALVLGGRRIDVGDYIERGEMVEVVRRQARLQNAPGAEWNYNNTGYGLLALVIERVTGQPFPQWMAENVFAPLGMMRTWVRETGAVIPGRAQGYAPTESGYREVSDFANAQGPGGMYTTVGDLARWIRNFRTGEVGGADLFRDMTTPFVLTDGDTTDYGLGFVVDRERGLRRVWHNGMDNAHRAQLVYYPDLDAGVVVLTNDASFGPEAVAAEIAETFFGDQMEDDAPTAPAAFDPATFDPARFDAYAGRYELEEVPGFVLDIRREGDRYVTQATGQQAVEIVPTSDSTFAIPVVAAGLTFHRDASGAVTALTLHQGGDHRARRLDVAGTMPPPAPDLSAYAGRYYSEELDAAYALTVEDGALVLHHRRLGAIPLRHHQGDAFIGAAFPPMELAFERGDDGRVTGLRVGNGRTRDVWFEKLD
ncbi:MAG TPA: serine hydrolase [Rubricoccaceae bacterium]|nr:serine hydrolase [Rubricoccaceae bacterium]